MRKRERMTECDGVWLVRSLFYSELHVGGDFYFEQKRSVVEHLI